MSPWSKTLSTLWIGCSEVCEEPKYFHVASIHFVAELGGNPEVGEARVVASLPHPGLVVLKRDFCQNRQVVLERNGYMLTSKNLWLADLINASVLSKSIVTYPFAFVPAAQFE